MKKEKKKKCFSRLFLLQASPRLRCTSLLCNQLYTTLNKNNVQYDTELLKKIIKTPHIKCIFQMVRLQMDHRVVLHHLYAVHHRTILSEILHDDPRWSRRRFRRRTFMVCQMYLSDSYFRSLRTNYGNFVRYCRDTVLRRLFHVLSVLASLGESHQFSW
jgi:hypothetical protein